MLNAFRFARPILFALPPEIAHRLTLRAIALGLAPGVRGADEPRLATQLFGRRLANPFGLAAGFDKNARAHRGLHHLGFGFIEVGGVTPAAQPGNPRPRLFRLPDDRAIINRMGFNNDGMAAIAARLAGRDRSRMLGVNLASNSATRDPIGDFATLIGAFAPLADFLTLDISCPNTLNGQEFLDPRRLDALLDRAAAELARSPAQGRPRLLAKLAPDLHDTRFDEIVGVLLARKIDGLIISNTSRLRPATLRSAARDERGGLSGPPLFARSNELLARAFALGRGAVSLIGVGGVSSGADAYAKLRAGAGAVQLYTALVYQGPAGLARMKRELAALLARDGYATASEAVGADHGGARDRPVAAEAGGQPATASRVVQ